MRIIKKNGNHRNPFKNYENYENLRNPYKNLKTN